MQAERAQAVQAALTQLSDSQQQILRLAYYEGLSQSTIAERINTPLGTVKTHARHQRECRCPPSASVGSHSHSAALTSAGVAHGERVFIPALAYRRDNRATRSEVYVGSIGSA